MSGLQEKIEDTMYMWFVFPVLWEAILGVYYIMLPTYPGAIWGIIGMWIIRIVLWIGGFLSAIKWITKIYDAIFG